MFKDVTRHTYICANHFVNGGPSTEFPHPHFAKSPGTTELPMRKSRKTPTQREAPIKKRRTEQNPESTSDNSSQTQVKMASEMK